MLAVLLVCRPITAPRWSSSSTKQETLHGGGRSGGLAAGKRLASAAGVADEFVSNPEPLDEPCLRQEPHAASRSRWYLLFMETYGGEPPPEMDGLAQPPAPG